MSAELPSGLDVLRGLGANVSPQRFAGLRTPRWRDRLKAALGEQAIEGRPFAEVVRRRLLAPIGMADAEPAITNAIRHRLAIGYGATVMVRLVKDWRADANHRP